MSFDSQTTIPSHLMPEDAYRTDERQRSGFAPIGKVILASAALLAILLGALLLSR